MKVSYRQLSGNAGKPGNAYVYLIYTNKVTVCSLVNAHGHYIVYPMALVSLRLTEGPAATLPWGVSETRYLDKEDAFDIMARRPPPKDIRTLRSYMGTLRLLIAAGHIPGTWNLPNVKCANVVFLLIQHSARVTRDSVLLAAANHRDTIMKIFNTLSAWDIRGNTSFSRYRWQERYCAHVNSFTRKEFRRFSCFPC